jgi:hypothetical protein
VHHKLAIAHAIGELLLAFFFLSLRLDIPVFVIFTMHHTFMLTLVSVHFVWGSIRRCHVMEVESFENEEVAKLLNDWFVSIKVVFCSYWIPRNLFRCVSLFTGL